MCVENVEPTQIILHKQHFPHSICYHLLIALVQLCMLISYILFRYMYWSDWGEEARIERAGMDGSNRTILHNTNLVWPNGITIDYANQILYWIDANLDFLEYSNVDGTGRTLLARGSEIFHPFSITLEEDFLFWTDWQQFAIFTRHKDLPVDPIISIYPFVYQPNAIEAVTPDRQRDGIRKYSVHVRFNSNCLMML